jgi:WD40 repeat protein
MAHLPANLPARHIQGWLPAAVVLVLAGLAAGARGETPTRTDRDGERLPAGVLARLGTRHWRHEVGITRLAFSPDGTRVITGDYDGSLRVWDTVTGRLCRRIDTGFTHVMALALAPRGTTAASAGMSRAPDHPELVELWDLATGQHLLRIERKGWEPRDLAFSPDGKTIAVAADGEGGPVWGVYLWDAATGKDRWHTQTPESPVSVAFSPDGRILAAGVAGMVRLLDPATGREVRRVEAEEYPDLGLLVFSPDGKAVAAVAQGSPLASTGEKHVFLWDVATGKKRQHFKIPIDGRGFEGRLAFSPDGTTLAASGNDGGITL